MKIISDINEIGATLSNKIAKDSSIKTVVSLIQYIIYYIWKTPCPKTIPFSFNRLPNTI